MTTGRFDDITAELRELRATSGAPSYGEIATRVMSLRMARGLTEWEARIGRTTVYDVFRPGRQKLDADLVADIVRALGGPETEAVAWAERCRRRTDRAMESAPAPPEPPHSGTSRPPSRPSRGWRVGVLLACLTLNLCDRVLVNVTHLPLYLDMVGTAVAALIVGPWEAAGVGAATSLLGAITNGWVSIPFIPVEVVGALLWGYGARRFRLARTLPRFLLLNVIVAFACSIVAVPIIVWLNHGITGSGVDQVTRSIRLLGNSLFAAVASSNILTSLADKLISGFFALSVAEALPVPAERPRLQLSFRWLQLRGNRSPGARV